MSNGSLSYGMAKDDRVEDPDGPRKEASSEAEEMNDGSDYPNAKELTIRLAQGSIVYET
jgi:hypothetical protein